MKVQRKMAQPYSGEPMPFKLSFAIEHRGAALPKPSEAEWPIYEAVRWMRHGDHPAVVRVSDTHGMVKSCSEQWSVVGPGEHILVSLTDGSLVHHPLQDISRWYDIR